MTIQLVNVNTKVFLVYTLLMLSAFNAHAKPVNLTISSLEAAAGTPELTTQAIKLIPKGYKKNGYMYADFNKDGKTDVAIIVKKVDAKNIVKNRVGEMVDRNRRGILVLLKTAQGYRKVIQNLSAFSSENEDGGVYFPPEMWLESKNGNLKVHYGHGRYGYWFYTFRFEADDFRLIGFDLSNMRTSLILSDLSINFLTQKKRVRENPNPGGKTKLSESWHKLKPNQPIWLSQIDDFDELDLQDY